MADFLFDEGKNKIEGLKKTEINAALNGKADAQAVASAFESVNTALNGKASTQALNEAVETLNTNIGGVESDVENVEAFLNLTNGENAKINESFVGYQRKTIFENVSLKANTEYYFRIAFNNPCEIQGYYAVSKTDNTTPDYAWTNLLGKKTAEFTYKPTSDLTVNITARFNNSGTYNFECSYSESKSVIYSIEDNIIGCQNDIEALGTINDPFKYKNRYDHLFTTRTGANCTIPMQSLFHVRISKRFGFDVIEGNVNKTLDGKYFVHHMAAGDTFGSFFHHVDGVTDISNIACTSVTWDWILQNVRYNSTIPKYRTAPCSLEEFLGECRQQELMPMLEIIDRNVVEMANKILGKDNYIAYGGNRDLTPNAVMFQWKNYDTKQEILDYCDEFGTPFIYGMALPSKFTDEELKDIINSLHEKGYKIGVSYVNENAYKFIYKGVDVDGSQTYINRIINGNLCNYESIFNYDDFTYTNATLNDGVLTFSNNGTITPNIDDITYQLCAIDLEIVFNGTISVPAIGEASAIEITSDGKFPYYAAVPIINGSPKVVISVNEGTIITDIKFKASIL